MAERSRARRAYRFVTLLLAFAVIFAGGVAVWGISIFQAPGPLTAETDVVFPRGADLRQISYQLQENGVIERADIFQVAVRLMRKSRQLKAGEFRFPAQVSPIQAMDILIRGETVVRRLTVPEGLLKSEVLEILAAADGLEGMPDTDAIEEGSLMPDTYHFSFGDQRIEILERMRNSMSQTVEELWKSRAIGLPLSNPQQAIVLASIVEKETAVAEERALVAGVFTNRLRRGMRLQSDPTVAYAVTGGRHALDRPLTREDLRLPHPYNTYMSNGLPPAPICNPGRDSLAAVLRPAKTDALYFVADGSGGHAFARTLDEHLINVARWRRLQRNNK